VATRFNLLDDLAIMGLESLVSHKVNGNGGMDAKV
jgi:hypothetical protein